MWGRLKRPSPRRTSDLVDDCRADDSDFCQEMVSRYGLTEAQMHHAAQRYQLGKSRSGRCIFWMMDDIGRVRDGHIGNSWASQMFKARAPELLKDWHARHCLFGLHLVSTGTPLPSRGNSQGWNQPVCIVEKERTAVILSEVYPRCLWMATVYPLNFRVDQLEPLRGRRLTLYPPTDPTADNFIHWLELSDQARRLYHLDISVSTQLEDHANQQQKQHNIDLLDFLLDSSQQST